MKKTVIIFGVSSFVGSNLVELLKNDYRIIGTYHKTPVEIPGVTCLPCDILKKEYVSNLISIFKPDYTIYAIGLSSLTDCKNLPKYSDALNSSGAVNALTASERMGSKFIYLSSSFVLGGDDLLYKEGETPFPSTVYGASMSASEYYIQRSCLNYLILRCAPLYGWSYKPEHPTWFDALQTGFAKGTPIQADDSVTTGFLDIFILGKVLKSVMESGATNRLLHVSSGNFMTRYEFAKTYAKVFGEEANLIQKMSANFPIDTSKGAKVLNHYNFKMDLENIETLLGAKLPLVEESLQFTKKRLKA